MEPVFPNLSEDYPSTIWPCCLRPDSTRKLFASLYLPQVFAPEPKTPCFIKRLKKAE